MNVSDLFRLLIRSHAWLPKTLSPSGRAFPPLYYGFEITRRCNLRCKMCQNLPWLNETPSEKHHEGELSTEDWFRVLDQLHWYNIISFTGGEPFMRRDFPELLAYASRRCRTHFVSNGQLITDAHVEKIVECAPRRMTGRGLIFVGISIDGPEEVHDGIRGRTGAFRKAVEAVRAIRSLREARGKQAPRIHVTSVLQADNTDRLHEMPAIAKAAGADVFNVTIEIHTRPLETALHIVNDPYAADNLSFPGISAERVEAALTATRRAAIAAGIELRLPNMPISPIVDHYAGRFSPEAFMCHDPWTCQRVMRNGDACLCWMAITGNVRDAQLKTLWNNQKARDFRKRIRRGLPTVCAGCCSLAYCANQDNPLDTEVEIHAPNR